MKLVIDLDEKIYNNINWFIDYQTNDTSNIAMAIKNGIPVEDSANAISRSDAKYACAKAYAEGYTWLHAIESCPTVNPIVVHEYTSAKTNLVEKDKVIGILESWREEMEDAINHINDAICEIEALPTVRAESEEGGNDATN